MNKLEQQKSILSSQLRSLCALCREGHQHECRISRILEEISNLHGIPIIVNDRLHHVMFN